MFDTPETAVFRSEVRAFASSQLPDDLRAAVRAGQPASREQTLRWHAILARQGWLLPHWPVEAGGCGWDAARCLVFDEEMCTNYAPELNSISFNMIGPVLIRLARRRRRSGSCRQSSRACNGGARVIRSPMPDRIWPRS